MTGTQQTVVVSFAEGTLQSRVFERLYKEYVAIAEETAEYLLTTEAQAASAQFVKGGNIFRTGALRLTERLLALENWMLLHRSIASGEGSLKACADELGAQEPYLSMLFPRVDMPDTLRNLMIRTNAISQEVHRLHQLFHPVAPGS